MSPLRRLGFCDQEKPEVLEQHIFIQKPTSIELRMKILLILLVIITSTFGQKRNTLCPDLEHECPFGATCCLMSNGDEYGCCPLPNAVCCDDHKHCCPESYRCDITFGQCVKNYFNSSKPIILKENSVICPGGEYQCPDYYTCCLLYGDVYGCCSIPNAVCCSDHQHCCPQGTVCDVQHGKCIQKLHLVEMQTKTNFMNVKQGSKFKFIKMWEISNKTKLLNNKEAKGSISKILCPDGQYECPDEYTCCKLPNGQWGCCPLPDAVCCANHINCCPKGSVCNPETGGCNFVSNITIPWVKKIPALRVDTRQFLNNVPCPGGKQFCPNHNTCCLVGYKKWGCCPLRNAVCCEDKIHCCPEGTVCETQRGICLPKQENTVPEQALVPLLLPEHMVDCPDPRYHCPSGSTCCKLTSGVWGCCPFQDAVCCADAIHCCPAGMKCSEFGCTDGISTFPWSTKNIAQKHD
ncbi:granulins-like isoform X2 [Limulus polyphemus]|uniref:Granulins-like isoform X2 n=1 Tax=Limulus polyphemus TaxID=6850 RepID=A0ABM1SVN0_LIMPO|nr:granulins-like isoform X2 [Limulus polyphemus]